MRTKVNCPECGKDLDSAGLKGHLFYAHKKPYQSENNTANSEFPPIGKADNSANFSELAETISEKLAEKMKMKREKREEMAAMAESENMENRSRDCPECRRREFKIIDLEHELSQAQKSNTALQEQINANSDRPIEIPDLNTVIQHCESGECTSHAKQWGEIKARIVQNAYDNLPPEAIPDKVVESEGLRRGFIPKKIIIPGIR